jgi:hypothetical protein
MMGVAAQRRKRDWRAVERWLWSVSWAGVPVERMSPLSEGAQEMLAEVVGVIE